MEPKDIKITIPEGYEIDMEKSTFERIVFKKKKVINSWEDLKKVGGYYINTCSSITYAGDLLENYNEHRNVFLNEKYAKSALAMAQISQLLPYYNTDNNYNTSHYKYCITRDLNNIVIHQWSSTYHLLSFNTIGEAERFLKYNMQLIKDYFMM